MFCSRLNENWLRLLPSHLGGIPPKNLSLVYCLSKKLVSTNTILPQTRGSHKKIFSITNHETFVHIHHFNNVRLLLGTILVTCSIKRG